MPTRNTVVLQSIIECLGHQIASPSEALAALEKRFSDVLLIVAGDANTVATHAEALRLAITEAERGLVLDHIAHTRAANITIDHTEDAINTLFEDRFVEP